MRYEFKEQTDHQRIREFQSGDQIARKRLENFRLRDNLLENKWRIPEEGASRSKKITEFQKRLDIFRRRSKSLERN